MVERGRYWGGKLSQVPIFFLMLEKEGERLQLEGEGGVMKDLHAVVEHLLCHTCTHKKERKRIYSKDD